MPIIFHSFPFHPLSYLVGFFLRHAGKLSYLVGFLLRHAGKLSYLVGRFSQPVGKICFKKDARTS